MNDKEDSVTAAAVCFGGMLVRAVVGYVCWIIGGAL